MTKETPAPESVTETSSSFDANDAYPTHVVESVDKQIGASTNEEESDDKPTNEPEDTSPTAEDDSESTVDQDLLDRAKSLGYSDDDIAGIPAEALASVIDRTEMLAFQQFRQRFQEYETPDALSQGPPPGSQKTGRLASRPGDPGASAAGVDPEFSLELDPTKLDDEAIVGAFQKLQAHLQAMNASLQQSRDFVTQYEEQQQADFDAWFDDQISELGGSVFGKGTIHSVSPEEQFKRQQAYQDYQAYLQYNGLQTNAKNADLLSRLVRLTSPNAVTEKQQKISDQVKRAASKTIGRPSGRKAPPVESADQDPETGVSRSTVEAIDSQIEKMLSQTV